MIDLRSDTVTRPTPGMRDAMLSAQVGDDVFGDDPTVNALETFAAERFNKEAALYLVSGTQSNLTALMAHCDRGDEYIVSSDAHTYKYEGGGAAVLGSIQPQPIEPEVDGTLSLEKIRNAVKPDDSHFANTKLLTLENTTGGRPLPSQYTGDALALAAEFGLSTHLDGARIFNAATATGVDAAEIAAPFDSVSVCLSKGLGAPIGSVLVGSRELIKSARRWRKVLGGGTRQVGFIAAAARYALEHQTDRLQEDHDNAQRLAKGLAEIAGVSVSENPPTNMVFATPPTGTVEDFGTFAFERGIKLYVRGPTLRLVTHLDVSAEDIDQVVAAFADFYGNGK